MMKLFSWNVNGLRAVIKKGEFAKFIEKYQPDILFLQETKAKKNQVENLPSNYCVFWSEAQRAGYSGTAILVKKPLEVQQVVKFTTESHLADRFGILTEEGRVTALEFAQFYLISVYTPNAKEDLSRLEIRGEWDYAFLRFVQELEKKKPVIFAGDLNVAHREIDLKRPRENEGRHGFTELERRGFQHYLDEGFVDSFRFINGDLPEQYSWWSHWGNARANNSGWRIDYFLVSQKLSSKIVSAKIYPEQKGSDHCPIELGLNL